MFERLTLVEFHLETDEFKPRATASLGDGEEGKRGLKRRLRRGASPSSGSDSSSTASDQSASMESGRARKAGPGLALLAVAGLFLVARRFQGRDRNR